MDTKLTRLLGLPAVMLNDGTAAALGEARHGAGQGLARFAVLHVEACHAAVRRGLSEARADLPQVADGDVVEAAVQSFLAEEARLVGVRREVGLVEEALRGRRYRARL